MNKNIKGSIKVINTSTIKELPNEYQAWLYGNFETMQIELYVDEHIYNSLNWELILKNEKIYYVQNSRFYTLKEYVDFQKTAIILVPRDDVSKSLLAFWYKQNMNNPLLAFLLFQRPFYFPPGD